MCVGCVCECAYAEKLDSCGDRWGGTWKWASVRARARASLCVC